MAASAAGAMASPARRPPAHRELLEVCEIVKGRLYFATCRVVPANTASQFYFSTDDDLRYEGFYADFGPLNLGMLYSYCQRLHALLMDPVHKSKEIFHITSLETHRRPNAAYLIGCFSVLHLGMTPELAFRPLAPIAAGFLPFRDASYGPCSFKLTVFDCLRGVHQAMLNGFLDFPKFNIDDYQCFERVENGDMNWVLPGKFLAFAGPHHARTMEYGYPVHAPEDFYDVFRRQNVQAVVRLNNKLYDRMRFVNEGFQHHDLFFVDGGIPSDHIIAQFLDIAERTKGGVAVHCKAGLGRTGTLIACFMMKHYMLTATECIAWLRVARPGSVLGPQQYFLQEKQAAMWRSGEHVGARRLGEDARPEWSRALRAQLMASGGIVLDPLAAREAAASASRMVTVSISSLSGTLGGMTISRTAIRAALPPIDGDILEPVLGKSQGDFLMAQKARRSRPRSATTGALRVEPPPRTRNPSLLSPMRVTGVAQQPVAKARLKKLDVR